MSLLSVVKSQGSRELELVTSSLLSSVHDFSDCVAHFAAVGTCNEGAAVGAETLGVSLAKQGLVSAQHRTAASDVIGRHTGSTSVDVDAPAIPILPPPAHGVLDHDNTVSKLQPEPRTASLDSSVAVHTRPPAIPRQVSTADVKLAESKQFPCTIDSPQTLFAKLPNL
jgi:hypothetical protein